MKNNTMSIDDVLSRYKADFERIWKEERYKWAAVKHYKDTWKIDAPDFASMLAEGFSKAASGPGALLAGGMYYPYKMITAFAREDPETVRSMFLHLYDESLPLAFRYTEFRAGCDKCLAAYRGNWEDRIFGQFRYTCPLNIRILISSTNTRCTPSSGTWSAFRRRKETPNRRFGSWKIMGAFAGPSWM